MIKKIILKKEDFVRADLFKVSKSKKLLTSLYANYTLALIVSSLVLFVISQFANHFVFPSLSLFFFITFFILIFFTMKHFKENGINFLLKV